MIYYSHEEQSYKALSARAFQFLARDKTLYHNNCNRFLPNFTIVFNLSQHNLI